jgi:mono/diheme cytochrome c family protein
MRIFKSALSAVVLLVAPALAAPATPAATAPSYHRDVAPILLNNCASCHRPGEAGPFALLKYEDAKRRASQIVDLTSRRVMPPWKAVGGDVHFVGERGLSDAQIATLRAWSDAGSPAGDPSDAPPMPSFPSGWQLGEPDLVVKMPAAYTVPADGPDIYRSFVIPVEIPPGKYVRAAEFRPGNRKVVHHAVLTTMDRASIAKKLADEPKDAGPGFKSGLAAPGVRLPGSPGIWVPGKDPLPLPEGAAMPWPKDSDLLVQLHLHPSGKVETEQSSIGFYLTDQQPKSSLRAIILANNHVDIAPGDKSFTLANSKTLSQTADVIGMFPHMHLLGRTCRTTATLPDGKTIELLNITDWDFRWQGYYQCKQPVRLPAGTKVDSVWTFDNSAENPAQPSQPPRRVRFGEQTTDEMGAMVLDVIPVGPPSSKSATRPAGSVVMGADADEIAKISKDLIGRFDSDHDGKLSRAELIAADPSKKDQTELAFRWFDADGDGKLDAKELAKAITAARGGG